MTKTYRVSGNFRMGHDWAHFSSEVQSDTPAKARERVYSEYGSRHHVGRRLIEIEKVEEVKEKDAGHGR
ncbi:MAG TPA: 50S ribosomal protein L18Ae [Candidatus Thermoplasmatota archaeon]|nr:50S ribosomal protein L18Ae [Candidatus Thermoplasmatota archaeon]